MAKYKITGLPKAQTGLIKSVLANAKNLARMGNIGTITTANTLAKTFAPGMVNPVHFLTFGMGLDPDIGIGPFTGSPLNVLPIGKKLEGDDSAFRKFGDTLDYVKLSRSLDPSHGALLRLGKSQIPGEGNWAAPNKVNEAYPGVFAAQFNTATPGSNLGYINIPNRRGVLVTDAQGNRMPKISIDDPGLSFHRRLLFSNRYIDVNMDKLRNDEFDWRTMGGNAQALLERYGYGVLGAAGLSALGYSEPQNYLDKYVNQPVIDFAKKTKDMIINLTEDEINEYRKGGYVVEYLDEIPKAQKGKQKRNSYLPGAWARTAPDLIEPGQEAFPLTQTPTIDPLISQERINTQTSANELRDYIIDYYSQNQSINEELNKKKYAERENYYKNLGANEKVTPIETIPIYDYNKIIKQNPSLEKNLKTQGVYINVNKERGFVEMFPANEVYQTILDGSIKNGKSVGETLKDLEKRGYGKVTDIKKQIGTEKLNQIETSVKQHYAYNPAYKPPYLKSNIMASSDYGKIDTSTDLQDKWSDNDIITLARDAAFIDAYDINNFDVTSPNARNDEKWNAQVINKLRSGKWGWKPKTNELIKLEADNAYEPLSIERKSAAENIIDKANAPAGSLFSTGALSQFWDEQDALRKRAQDYTKLGADKFQEKYSPTQEQLQSKWKQGKEAVDIADDASWRPQEMTQKGQRYKYSFEQPYGVDPTTGELITTQVSPDDYAGQTVYLSPEERDKYNKSMTAANMQSVQSHPLYYLPGAIATGTAFAPTSWGGLGLGSSMLNTPIASIPGLTAGNALNAYFGYETLKDEGLAEQAYDAFQKGDIAEGLKNTLYSGLSLAPFAKGAKTLYDVTKGLTGPGMYAGKIATNLPLSASWTNPALTKGLAIQNPGWSSATKELLPGFTSRFNKALGPQLGQIKLYGAGTNPAASSQGLLGNSGALGLSGKAAPIYYNLDDYMGPNVSVPIKYPADSYSPFKPEGQPWQGGNWTYEYDPNKPKEFKGAGLDFNYYKSTLPPFSSKAFSDIGDFNFKPFSEGWLANQRMSNLATYGKQPLLKRSDFATNEEMMIDKLMAKHKGNFDAMLKEAEEEQISPDAVLKRQLDKITYKADPKLRSERPAGSAPFYLPENWSTSNRATIWNNNFGNYRPFGKELNEFGTMGGKPAISFGESGELDRFYFDQIKKYEDLLAGDTNMSPEQRADIQQKLNNIYQKGVKSGIQNLDINLSNPWNYKPGLSGLSPNQYGGELPEAQFGLTKYLAPAAKTLSEYIMPPVSQLSKYLTTQTPLRFVKDIQDAGTGPNISYLFSEQADIARKLQQADLLGKDVNISLLGKYPNLGNAVVQKALKNFNTTYRAVDPNVNQMTLDEMIHLARAGYRIDDPIQVAQYMSTHVPLKGIGYRAAPVSAGPGQDMLFTGKFKNAEEARKHLRIYGTHMSEVRPPMDFSTGSPANWFQKYYSEKPFIYGTSAYPIDSFRLLDNKWQPGSIAARKDNEYWPYIGERGDKLLEAVRTIDLRGYKPINTPYLSNPWEHKSGLSNLSSNKYGGLHKAQFGKIIQDLEGMMQVAPRFTKLPSANILNAIPEETHALNKMLGFAAGPQYQLSSKDFFTDDELIKMAQQQVDYQNARDQFDIDNPQNPGMAVWNSLLGDTSREELFSLLYPNASMPNFKSKFIFPQAEKQLQTYLRDYNVPSLRNKGDISKGMLGNLTKDLNKEVPYQLKYLNDMQDEKGWLYTADPKIVVTEHRGSLGLTSDDIKNASPEQFEKWRQQLVKTIKANSLIAYKSLLGNPFTAKDAYSKMKLNKYGGSK